MIDESDKKIISIQKSTRTLIPSFIPIHNLLRLKLKWYYVWHLLPKYKLAHYSILAIYLLTLCLAIFSSFTDPSQSRAADESSYDFARWEYLNPNPIGQKINAIWAYDINNIWTVGDYGTINQFKNQKPVGNQPFSSTSENILDIDGISPYQIWAVTTNGNILFYDGNQRNIWSLTHFDGVGDIVNIAVKSADCIYAVSATKVFYFNGSNWAISDNTDIGTKIMFDNEGNLWKNAYTYRNELDKIWQTIPQPGETSDYYALDTNHVIYINTNTFGPVYYYDGVQHDGDWWRNVGNTNYPNSKLFLRKVNNSIVGYVTLLGEGEGYGSHSNPMYFNGNVLSNIDSITVSDSENPLIYMTESGEPIIGTPNSMSLNILEDSTWLNINQNLSATSSWTGTEISLDKKTIWISNDPEIGGKPQILKFNTETNEYQTITLPVHPTMDLTQVKVFPIDANMAWCELIYSTFNTVHLYLLDTSTVPTFKRKDYSTNTSGHMISYPSMNDPNQMLYLTGTKIYLLNHTLEDQDHDGVEDIVLTEVYNNLLEADYKFLSNNSGSSVYLIKSATGSTNKLYKINLIDNTLTLQEIPTPSVDYLYQLGSASIIDENNIILAYGQYFSGYDEGSIYFTNNASSGNPTWYSITTTRDENMIFPCYMNISSIDKDNFYAIDYLGDIYFFNQLENRMEIFSEKMHKDPNMTTTGAFPNAKIFAFSKENIYAIGDFLSQMHYYSPPNSSSTKLQIQMPYESFDRSVNYRGIQTNTQAKLKAGSFNVNILATGPDELGGENKIAYGSADYFKIYSDPTSFYTVQSQLTQNDTCVQTNPEPNDITCGEQALNLSITKPGTYRLKSEFLNKLPGQSWQSSIFTILPGDPSKISISAISNTKSAGQVLGPITLNLKDMYSNITSPTSNTKISLSSDSTSRFSTSAYGPWSNTLTVTIPSGIPNATPSLNKYINFYYRNTTTGSHTITATSPGLASANQVILITPGSIDLDKSSFSCSPTTIKAGGSTNCSAILKDSNNNPISSKSVKVISSRSYENTSRATTTNSSGLANFRISSTKSGSFVVNGIDTTDEDTYLTQEPVITVLPGPPSEISSFISATKNKVIADGHDSSTINVFTLDKYKNPTPGKKIILISDESTDRIKPLTTSRTATPNHQKNYLYKFTTKVKANYYLTDNSSIATTNSNGKASFNFSSSYPHTSTLVAKDFDTGNIIATYNITTFWKNITPYPSTLTPTPTDFIIPTPIPTTTLKKNAITKTIEDIRKNKQIQNVTSKYLKPIAESTAAATGIMTILNGIASLPSLFQFLSYIVLLIAESLGIKRKPKPWGIVFDAISARPVDLAIVRLFNADNKQLLATRVTDLNGRFGFSVSPGDYVVSVTKPGYIFPITPNTKKYLTKIEDYYYGAYLRISEASSNLSLSIPLEPVESRITLNAKLRLVSKSFTEWMTISAAYIFFPLFIIGILSSAIAALVLGTPRNMIFFVLYVALFVFYLKQRIQKLSRIGAVIDQNGRPISNATINVFDAEYKTLRATATTNHTGHFSLLVPTGTFYLSVQKPGFHYPPNNPTKSHPKHLYKGENITIKEPRYISLNLMVEED